MLSEWIKSSSHVVVHTGAGISTSAGQCVIIIMLTAIKSLPGPPPKIIT